LKKLAADIFKVTELKSTENQRTRKGRRYGYVCRPMNGLLAVPISVPPFPTSVISCAIYLFTLEMTARAFLLESHPIQTVSFKVLTVSKMWGRNIKSNGWMTVML
jgi:hypothetical protein